MRFRLLDLLVTGVVCLIGAFTGLFIQRHFASSSRDWPFFYGFAVISYVLLTPIIYRIFRLKALWLPKCPNCGSKHRHYIWHIEESIWPREVIYCGTCKQKIILWYSIIKKKEDTAVPQYLLLWPQSWGRWKRIPENTKDENHGA